MIRQSIARLTKDDFERLNEQETRKVAEEIMSGEATPSQISSFITALRIRGERVENIVGFVRVMREMATPLKVPENVEILDTCGTGGDGSNTFNISTVSALICASAGVKVAKHGNRGVSSSCGSADVLEKLGVRIDISPEKSAECLEKYNFCFLFAPVYHKAMKYAVVPRKEIGIRTIFNLIGPLSNPAGATCQVIGVFDESLLDLFAETLKNLGAHRAIVVHGSAGLDELSLLSASTIAELGADGRIEMYPVEPADYDMETCEINDLVGGGAEENARIVHNIFEGKGGHKMNAALLNAGAGLYISGKSDSIYEGVLLARETVESGKPAALVEKLRDFTNR